ncbi:BEN domain-containing protein 7 [Xenopus laevis]|uniref:BEN domain-containing protein 7 n=1 Tax=Xenopus laevis TaxID=8355 RepID=A0A8J1MM51_XENLA|nr:BEN domain-containing protein 7 [Xenopus laevis]
MEFSERKRSRKSQSFKLVNQEYHQDVYKTSDYCSDINGESRDSQSVSGDEGMEIKKQITGMRRLLNDSTGRVYQRVGKEGEKLKEEPQEIDLHWAESLNTPCAAEQAIHPSQNLWNNTPIQTEFSGQYGTRSKTIQNNHKNAGLNGDLRMANAPTESKCCTCNCQPTLQAILQELKAMRKFMQVQAVAHSRMQLPQSCVCNQKTAMARKRIIKKKVLSKNTAVAPVISPPSASEKEHKAMVLPEKSSLAEKERAKKEEEHMLGFGIVVDSSSSDPDIQLAEGFDVFMPKSQLDSILTNYKRSGSLLFRKLVCAFFDDKTLATSLPNGKRKRGLNDNRQGLDQNIVGAIKVFTEKYCTANKVEKVPGPRHWVQILQDQIKLARRRLKRGCDLGNHLQTPDDRMWHHSKTGF